MSPALSIDLSAALIENFSVLGLRWIRCERHFWPAVLTIRPLHSQLVVSDLAIWTKPLAFAADAIACSGGGSLCGRMQELECR
jgi:hypothetical protein